MAINIEKYLTPQVLLVLFLLIISLIIVFPVLDMVILGAILAYGLRPIAKKIQSKLKFPSVSIILSIILVIIPLILLLAYIIFVITGFISDYILTPKFDFTQISGVIPQNYVDVGDFNSIIKDVGKFVMNYMVSLISSLSNIIMSIFILICSTYYFVKDGDNCYEFIKSFIPSESMDFFNKTVESVQNVLKSIFYGHFLTSVIIGIIAAVGYSLLGYPYGIFLGVMTGILQLIPVFGPWPIYWSLAIIDVVNGNYIRVAVVLIFGFFLSLIDMYIRPALSSHHADIHPLILLIGFLAGPVVYGIVGFILGPLILGITYAILDSFRQEIK